MAKPWINDFIKINKWTRPGRKLHKVVKLVKHYTANPGASARNHHKYFGETLPALNDKLVAEGREDETRSASAQIFVDRWEALCIIPLDEEAFAVNDGTYRGIAELLPNANYLTINVELCIEKDGSFHPDTVKRAKAVFAELCRMFNKNPMEDIVRHYDITHKPCPLDDVRHPEKFIDFKKDVAALLNENNDDGVIDLQMTKEELKKFIEDTLKERNDLPVSSWAEKVWANAVANGYYDGTKPQAYETREQAAAVVTRVVYNIRQFVVHPLEVRITELEEEIKQLKGQG